MAVTKRIVCLANSRKLQGRCVAGVELTGGRAREWVRPVGDREHQAVSEHERQYRDGSDPRLLDIIDVPLLEHRPKDYQRENWLLDPKKYWKKAGVFKGTAWRRLPRPNPRCGGTDAAPTTVSTIRFSSPRWLRRPAP